MAIPVSTQQPRRTHWFGWLVTLVILGGLSYVAYQVYFSPVTLFDKTAGTSAPPDTLSTIARVEFNPEELKNNPEFKALQEYVSQVGVGETGKDNPFLRF